MANNPKPDATVPLPPPAIVSFDPNRSLGALSYLIRAAANGEPDAQRALFRETMGTITCGLRPNANPARAPYMLALEAISYARLSASHGKREDVWDLVNALVLGARSAQEVASMSLSDYWANEALGILKSLSDDGDADAATASEALLANPNLLGVQPTHPTSAQVH